MLYIVDYCSIVVLIKTRKISLVFVMLMNKNIVKRVVEYITIFIVFFIIVFVNGDVYSHHYKIDTDLYIEGNDIVSEFDIDYSSDYEKWHSCFEELSKYLRPEYINVWNSIEGVDFFSCYRRAPRGIEGIGVDSDTLIEGLFGYYGVLHSVRSYDYYDPQVYKFKNLIKKLKSCEKNNNDDLLTKKTDSIINKIRSFLSMIMRNKNDVHNEKFETMEFGHNIFGGPLQWIILDKDETKKEYLLLSRDKYNNITENKDNFITWNQSKTRKFLNEEFYEKSFSDKDKEKISLVDFFDEQLKENINDRVYILSHDEIKKYLYSNENNFYNFNCFTYYEWDGNDIVLDYSYNNKLCKRHTRDIFTIRNYGYRDRTFSSIDIDGNIYPFETHIHPAIRVKYE
jgi:hypothetical protein